MTRIASKFGIAAALTLGVFSTAAAQGRTTNPTTTVGVSKGEVVKPETVTVVRRDTVTVYRRDTVTVAGPTVTRWDTVTVTEIPGWLNNGDGFYFGLGAGSFYPNGGIGAGQIPGYAFQTNLGWDPAGSWIGGRLTAGLARPDESQPYANLGARPTIWNFTADLKLGLPFLSMRRFPSFGVYAVGGAALVTAQAVRYETDNGPAGNSLVAVRTDGGYHNDWGWNLGGGATVNLGHSRQLFLEARAINYSPGENFKHGVQLPIILGVNWY
jgi:hypothetical protein